ncbi:MAG TPA: hypothetical protein VD833_08390, partial [Vicinamibacterales bacterium]|nr:hypothetical protein [Vicinamibacterales bacterium]
GDWEGGVGDVALAVKRVLFHSLPRGAIFSAALELVLPTGREERGIGSGVTRVEPFVAYGQILPRDAFVQVQTGLELSTDTAKAGHEAFWRAAAGRTFAQAGGVGRAWTPMIEILGARELDQGQGAEWDVVPQLQVSLSRRQHVLVNAGVRIPLNERQARHPVVIAYLLWDWFDGGFFTGWR